MANIDDQMPVGSPDYIRNAIVRLTKERYEARAEIERLKAMVVWTAQRETYVYNGKLMVGPVDEYPCDGSPASILAAVSEAMK